jgi:hypothetical protein
MEFDPLPKMSFVVLSTVRMTVHDVIFLNLLVVLSEIVFTDLKGTIQMHYTAYPTVYECVRVHVCVWGDVCLRVRQ